MSAPFFYNYINTQTSSESPSTVHVENSASFRFFRRYLMQKVYSVFKWTLPREWDADYFQTVLYAIGHIAIIKTRSFGVIPQQCGLYGYNVFYRPTNAIVANPLLPASTSPRIDRDCVLIKLCPDYGGIMDAVNYYAAQMALCSESIGVNLINSRLAFVFGAEQKNIAESFKTLYDKIVRGEPAVFVDSKLFRDDGNLNVQEFQQNLGQYYIVDRLLSDLRRFESEFDTIIGIPNANTDKRERLISDEVNANNLETRTRPDIWLESMQEGCEKANSMFGLALSVDYRNKEVYNHGDDVDPRIADF